MSRPLPRSQPRRAAGRSVSGRADGEHPPGPDPPALMAVRSAGTAAAPARGVLHPRRPCPRPRARVRARSRRLPPPSRRNSAPALCRSARTCCRRGLLQSASSSACFLSFSWQGRGPASAQEPVVKTHPKAVLAGEGTWAAHPDAHPGGLRSGGGGLVAALETAPPLRPVPRRLSAFCANCLPASRR